MNFQKAALLLFLGVLQTTPIAQAADFDITGSMRKAYRSVNDFIGLRRQQEGCQLKLRGWQNTDTWNMPLIKKTTAHTVLSSMSGWQECYSAALEYSSKYAPTNTFEVTLNNSNKEKEIVTYHNFVVWQWQGHEGAVTALTPKFSPNPLEGDRRIFSTGEGDGARYFNLEAIDTFLLPEDW